MKNIPLTKGQYALVDDEDFEWLNSKKWQVNEFGYATTVLSLGKVGGNWKRQRVHMHRLVAMTPSDKVTDHINGVKTDNRKVNLRVCMPRENSYNRNSGVLNSSGYHGVTWNDYHKKWVAAAMIDKRHHCFGHFDTKE